MHTETHHSIARPDYHPRADRFALSYRSFLPECYDVTEVDDVSWNRVKVNTVRCDKELHFPEKVQQKLKGLHESLVGALCLWVGIEAERGPDLRTALANHLSYRRTEPVAKLIYYLLNFCDRKRFDAVEKYGYTLLDSEEAEFLGRYTQRLRLNSVSWRFAFALLVYCTEPRRLLVLHLAVQTEDLAFSRYKIGTSSVEDSSDAEQSLAALAQAIAESPKLLESLDEQAINTSLQTFEADRATEKESRCWCVHRDSETGRKTIFILRQTREEHIQAVDKVVFADKAELIVIRFMANIEIVELHARDKTGRELVGHFIGNQIRQPNVSYENIPPKVEPSALVALVRKLSEDGDRKLRLIGVQLRQAPLAGHPCLALDVQPGDSLRPALLQLKNQQLDVLAELRVIERLTLRFSTETKESSFDLRPACQTDGWYQVAYSAFKVGADTKKTFEEHLGKTHRVHVYPKSL